jgi:hypothetical protein
LSKSYEPEYTEEKLAAVAATNEESTNNEEDEAIDKNVCSCGHCALLPKQRESLIADKGDKLNTNMSASS